MELIEGNVLVSTVFNNGLIADNIGAYLSVPDLKSCRRVSEEWYKWASGPMRKKGFFVLRTLNDFRKLAQHPDEDYQLRPHKQVVFRLPILNGSKMAKCLEDFWLVHREGLTYLKLDNVEDIGGEILQDILYRQTPNLKTLIIAGSRIGRNEAMEHVNIAEERVENRNKSLKLKHLELMDIFGAYEGEAKMILLSAFLKLYPNIKILRLGADFSLDGITLSCYDLLSTVLDPFIEVRKTSPEILSIKELDILPTYRGASYGSIEMPFVKTLESLNFPLSSLSFNTGEDTGFEVIAGILSLFKKTLTTLEIYCPRAENSIQFDNFPFGIELKTLKSFSLSDVLSSTMKFVKWMPSLEVLVIWCFDDRGSRKMRKTPNVMERTKLYSIHRKDVKCLKELTFETVESGKGQFFSEEMDKRFSKWMPKVEITWIERLKSVTVK